MRIDIRDEAELHNPSCSIETSKHVIIKSAAPGPRFLHKSGESFTVNMRVNGFEFFYGGEWYIAADGKVENIGITPRAWDA